MQRLGPFFIQVANGFTCLSFGTEEGSTIAIFNLRAFNSDFYLTVYCGFLPTTSADLPLNSMSPRHHSQLYRQLRDVDPRDNQQIIRMYEERENEIGRLDVEEYFELTVYYADALFATGAYRQHLMMVDLVIQASMRHNISDVQDVEGDIFQHLLFRKAVSAYRLRDYELAAHVARELIRINPERDMFVRFLRITYFKAQHKVLQFGRGAFIFCILLAAAAVTFELLFVRPFYSNYLDYSQAFIVVAFVGSISLLLGAYLFAHLRAHLRAYGFWRDR